MLSDSTTSLIIIKVSSKKSICFSFYRPTGRTHQQGNFILPLQFTYLNYKQSSDVETKFDIKAYQYDNDGMKPNNLQYAWNSQCIGYAHAVNSQPMKMAFFQHAGITYEQFPSYGDGLRINIRLLNAVQKYLSETSSFESGIKKLNKYRLTTQ